MILETEPVPKSWARVFQPRIRMTISDIMHFQFKGKLLDSKLVFGRVGIAMEGPNEIFSLSPKFGLESDEHGQFSQLVVANGLVRMTMGIPVSVKKDGDERDEVDEGKYYFMLYNNRLVLHCPGGCGAIVTSCIPDMNRINQGISLGLETLDAEKKKLLVDSAKLYCM